MRKTLLSLALVFASISANAVDVSLSIGSPNLHIGVNVREYPRLVPIQGYPVYYSPDIDSNYFFYDGLYWVYQDDNWYASSWYNGPWGFVDPYAVPVYVLRVPVRYYHRPPVYFREWAVDAPPRWGDHWGREWYERRPGWDHWDHRNVPRPLPLPLYQRQYGGDRYPDLDRQRDLQQRNYHYQPRNPVVAAHYKDERQQNDQWRAQNQRRPNESHDAFDRRQQQQREEQQQKIRRDEDQKQQERQRQEQEKQEQQQQARREQDRQQQDRRQQEQQQQLHREEEQRQQAQRQQQQDQQQQQARRAEDQRQQAKLQQEQRQQQARQQENQQAKQREEQQRQQAQQQSQEQQRQAEQQRQQQARQQVDQQRQQQQNQAHEQERQHQNEDKKERPRENPRDKEKSDKDRDNDNK
jgi:hypothetical protein